MFDESVFEFHGCFWSELLINSLLRKSVINLINLWFILEIFTIFTFKKWIAIVLHFLVGSKMVLSVFVPLAVFFSQLWDFIGCRVDEARSIKSTIISEICTDLAIFSLWVNDPIYVEVLNGTHQCLYISKNNTVKFILVTTKNHPNFK